MDVECPHCKRKFDLNLKCKRCGHGWIPRSEKLPAVCPKCKSPYWNKLVERFSVSENRKKNSKNTTILQQ